MKQFLVLASFLVASAVAAPHWVLVDDDDYYAPTTTYYAPQQYYPAEPYLYRNRRSAFPDEPQPIRGAALIREPVLDNRRAGPPPPPAPVFEIPAELRQAPDAIASGSSAYARSTPHGPDYVDYGAYTGGYGAFGWYSDHPVLVHGHH